MYQMTHAVLRALHDDHVKTLGLLERFEALLRRIGPDRPPSGSDADATTLLAEMVANMTDEVDHHFAFEEGELFPRFSRVAEPGIPAMLQAEHEAMRSLARRLTELAAGAGAAGFDPAAWAEFHRLGRELVEREVFHIQKEEMGFLPAMDQILQPGEAAELADLYRRKSGSS
ncbi:hemerythrin domain-containing protein [Shumkonia mesophila]|uniref:hemerythrin domain-containing protein n=1 Tax=Shumkonia mesophila TaxID=2838854 RepID=UPI002934C3CE|nr:hemerythrin domain-containing protein [Shumkonia mesophila]